MLPLALSKLNLVSLANGASQSQISLLVDLGVHLKSSSACVVRNLLNRVHDRLDVMLFAPDGSIDIAGVAVDVGSENLIFSRSLDRRDVEAKLIASLESTRDVETRVTVPAVDASAFVVAHFVLVISVLAKFANGFVLGRWNKLKALGHLKRFRIAESDLWRENCAVHMHPIVASSGFQRLSRHDGTVFLQLLSCVSCPHGIGQLFFHALLLAVALALLLVSRLRHLNQINQSLFRQAQAARIIRGYLGIAVVQTLFAHPRIFAVRPQPLPLANAEAGSMHGQQTVFA